MRFSMLWDADGSRYALVVYVRVLGINVNISQFQYNLRVLSLKKNWFLLSKTYVNLVFNVS